MVIRDLFTLRIFVLACELKSVTKAAERLNIAVSAASRRIQLLEHVAGAPLLHRKPHGIVPTELGITVMQHARDMIGIEEKLNASIEEHRSGLRGHVRVWSSMAVLEERLACDIVGYLRAHPDVKLDLQERTSRATVDALLNKQTDIGVIVRGLPTDGLEVHDYHGDILAVALPAGHPLAARGSVRLSDLLDEDFISLEPDSATNRLLVDEARRVDRCIRTRTHVTSFGVMCSMIARGLGIGILPQSTLGLLGHSLAIETVPLDEPWAVRTHAICVRNFDELDTAAQGFIAYLRRTRLDEPFPAPTPPAACPG